MTAVWRTHLITLGIVIAGALAIFHRDAADMAAIWWNISTYNHCLFILPIIGWLIWQRKDELARLTPNGWWPGLIGVGGSALVWMLGEAAGVALFRHAALIGIVQFAVATVLGPRVTRGLLFPLFYLVFLIPFGDEFVPLLQTITARMSMSLLGLFGVPAHIEGVFITIPTGLFEVAEACSGVKFLVAMAAYATLAANVCYKSWARRFAFLAMALSVPIFANGIRAFSTIYVSHLSGNTDFAAGFDHIIFGWVFFGVVMASVMLIGWRWFDRGINDPWIPDVFTVSRPATQPIGCGIATVMIALTALLASHGLDALGREAMPNGVELPQVAGWTRVSPRQSLPWSANFDGADHKLWGQYADALGNRIDLTIVLYAWQSDGRELVGYGQGAYDPESDWAWSREMPSAGVGRSDIIFSHGISREVATFYWINGRLTGSASRVKFETLKTRLFGRDQAGVAMLVSSEDRKDQPARPKIEAFVTAMGSPAAVATAMIAQARRKP